MRRFGCVSTVFPANSEIGALMDRIAVAGGGVIGSAVALALARRGAEVIVLESEEAPGLGASGTNSGIVHTGFDSVPGELETELILRAGELRDPVLAALGLPVLRCGAVMRPADAGQAEATAELAANAARNGVAAERSDDGVLEIPGEAVTDPVRFTLALADAAVRHGAELRTAARVEAIGSDAEGLRIAAAGDEVECGMVVNCAGLGAAGVARMLGDESFEIYPRKGEFLVFDPAGEPLDRILLPVPTKRTKGVLVFPTLDGKVVAGPTAVDQDDPEDWTVRPEARDEILGKAASMYPPLAHAEPVFAYAGLRPAGRGANYVIGPSRADPRLINVAAIRSTGLTASLGIAERVAGLVAAAGVDLGPEEELKTASAPELHGAWWRRTAEYRAG
jgi:glycerol-3-phosphate dehydrogenase